MRMRSLLFVPGDSERKLARSEGLPADILILDLEDAVAPENKAAARSRVVEFIGNHPPEARGKLWVRINPIDQAEAGADLSAVVPLGPGGIVQPKPRSPEDVTLLAKRIRAYEEEHEMKSGSTLILPVATETPGSLFRLGEYGTVGRRLAGLTWGAEDLGAAVGATERKTPDGEWTSPYQFVRSLCLFAAHAAGVAAIDTLHADFRDEAGLRNSCEAARRDGFNGKLAIHPSQVDIINQAFTPSAEEVARARRIVELFAANPGAGTLALDGAMLDQPHLVQARKILSAMEEG